MDAAMPQKPQLPETSTPIEDIPLRASFAVRLASFLGVVVPLLGLVAAIILLWGRAFDWIHLGLLLGLYVATVLGVTIGFHRLFTHRSFEARRPVQAVLAVLGSMAVQGPLMKWVAVHRRHHQLSDQEGDPHSPHHHGEGLIGFLKGFWHAHTGWLFGPDDPNLARYVPDLLRDRMIRSISKLFSVWVLVGLAIPTLVGGLVTMSWFGALLGFLWGGLVRIFLAHHVTWSINSICHLWGRRPFRSRDHSRNNLIFGVLGMGEGWHNNHHAFPTSARHGLKWWQIDISYLIIRAMELLSLAWHVRVPSPDVIASKMKDPDAADGSATSPASA